MATRFPTQFSDSFTYSNGLLPGPWIQSSTPLSVTSNQVKDTGLAWLSLTGVGYPYNVGNDIAIQTTIANVAGTTTNDQFSLYVRMDGDFVRGYKARWLGDGTLGIFNTPDTSALKVVNVGSPVAGKTFAFQAIGPCLTVFINGSPALSVYDTGVAKGDYIGIGINNAGNALDNFAVIKSIPQDNVDSTTNTKAAVNTVNNELICDRTGFRIPVDVGLVREWTGAYVRKESWEPRHPQDFVRSRPEHLKGSVRPQQSDNFLTTNVTVNDLG